MSRKLIVATLWLACCLMAPLSTAGAKEGGPVFFLTLSSRTFHDQVKRAAVHDVLARRVTAADYISDVAGDAFPDIAARVGRAHLFALAPSVQSIDAARCGRVGLVLYDGEHWDRTPRQEQANMAGAIASARDRALKSGCTYGIVPDAEFIGIPRGQCSLAGGLLPPGALVTGLDWHGISVLDIQAQKLLGDQCAKRRGADPIGSYVAFLTVITKSVRPLAPSLTMVGQVSLRQAPAERLVKAIERARPLVDGFFVFYSLAPDCNYCTAEALDSVLNAVRP